MSLEFALAMVGDVRHLREVLHRLAPETLEQRRSLGPGHHHVEEVPRRRQHVLAPRSHRVVGHVAHRRRRNLALRVRMIIEPRTAVGRLHHHATLVVAPWAAALLGMRPQAVVDLQMLVQRRRLQRISFAQIVFTLGSELDSMAWKAQVGEKLP